VGPQREFRIGGSPGCGPYLFPMRGTQRGVPHRGSHKNGTQSGSHKVDPPSGLTQGGPQSCSPKSFTTRVIPKLGSQKWGPQGVYPLCHPRGVKQRVSPNADRPNGVRQGGVHHRVTPKCVPAGGFPQEGPKRWSTIGVPLELPQGGSPIGFTNVGTQSGFPQRGFQKGRPPRGFPQVRSHKGDHIRGFPH
jgi:hypothetical protein